MLGEKKRIVVAGDLAVDWFMYPVDAQDEGANWQLQPAKHQSAMAGGAVLLGEFVEMALMAAGVKADVIRPELSQPITAIRPDEVVHSNAILDRCKPWGDAQERVLRVRSLSGFMGPQASVPVPEISPNPDQADVVVLDDVGNGFRDRSDSWPKALECENAIIIYKMSRPLAAGGLWQRLSGLRSENLVVVIGADDLRRTEEVYISRALSWERTAKDALYQILRSNRLRELQACPHVIVLLGTDGAILYRGGENASARLFFDPTFLEGGFSDHIDGTVFGLASIFTATLAAELAKREPDENGLPRLENAVALGLARARALLVAGYARCHTIITHQTWKALSPECTGEDYASCPIQRSHHLNDADPDGWRILNQCTRNTQELIARNIVAHGLKGTLHGVPIGTFGELGTIDRAEIESYSAIRTLIVEFLHNPKPERPLCFAVFGPPGSGKSFGVKQVLASIGSSDVKALPAFNVSQFREYGDLIAALDVVRDEVLSGKVPVAFFDEFDAEFDGESLGWLKYFLAPMHDGKFRRGEAIHPVGKAIFVFAGGTRSSLQSFQRDVSDDEVTATVDDTLDEDAAKRSRKFRDAKGPDFVSRLRGYVNIMGPNRQGEQDDAFVIRRAMLLRSLLEKNPKTAACFDSKRRFRIDTGVLRAMLHVEEYRHGSRSIEALLDMSRLAGKQRYDLSALPAIDQLDLHVDAQGFMFLTVRERFQSMLPPREWPDTTDEDVPPDRAYRAVEDWFVERAAKAIHEDYRRHRELIQRDDVGPYEKQPEEFQQSNKDAAEDIPGKLLAVHHGIRKIPKGRAALTPDLTDNEVRQIAQREHDRWCAERRLQGFVRGEKKGGRKFSPSLVSFDKLPEQIQDYDIQAVRALPGILMELGYEIFRMQEFEEIDDALIDQLARAIHDDYCAQRRKDDHTPETNPALVEYDKLSPHLQASNRDSASTIPRKLRAVGYALRRPPGGKDPAPLKLTDDQIEIIAELEHARWNWHHWLNGWTYKAGPKDEVNKTHPCLLPWNKLPSDVQDYDRQSAGLIPQLLVAAGYEACRLPE